MPCRQHQHREFTNLRSSFSGYAELMTEYRALQRRVEMLQRQLRATANLQALLAAKDRELAACRARLEQHGGSTTTTKTWCEQDVKEDGEATTNVQEHQQCRLEIMYNFDCVIAYFDKRAPILGLHLKTGALCRL